CLFSTTIFLPSSLSLLFSFPLFESQLLPFLFYFFITHQYLLLFHCSNPLSCLFSITIFLPLSHYSSTSSTSFHYSLLLLSSIPLFYSLYPNIFFSLSLQN
ncbi:uncharacterized protein PWA37_002495, partial [Arxiozyma heterogenica]|uniref:uncharacterized protein n=1 Tax=Arxiozyma heterogenica TaxID=278026 RepID=UPI002EE324A1